MRIIENDSEIRQRLLSALLEEVRDSFNKSVPQIQRKIQEAVVGAIKGSPEYSSLVSGQLKLELGIPDAASKIEELLNIWTSNIEVEIKPFKVTNMGLSGGFSIHCIKSDFSDVLSTDAAQVEDNIRSYSLPWLSWLLLEGGKILVKDHVVVVGSSPFSRTGGAIMRTSMSSSWRVPPEFAGTERDNWITRAIDQLDDEITKIFQETIESNI